ncbi:MAG TPA: TonB-dependent receptor, partial [Blastocatellia bacterium]|nr:TonB-dependent receptor [Blastocatellia bacterium]
MQRSVSAITARLLAIFCSLGLTALLAVVSLAQAPTGTISGTVVDQSGAVLPKAEVTIRNQATGIERKLSSTGDGAFSAPSLLAGEYLVTAKLSGFRTYLQTVTVTTGSIVKVEIRMEVGQTTDTVTVAAAGEAQINFESHSVDGVITRQKIQNLPLNGRSFLNLASLEPGVTVTPGITGQFNSLFAVSILGGETSRTAVTIDGGNVINSIDGGIGMNFSQEIVQEFQLSSNNFDLSTGITSVGSVNIVTRTGGNDFHGSGYYYFRDHNMAAYPGLARNAISPDPFFARRNPGLWVGGPIVKNRLFFFANYEYMNQTQVYTTLPDLPSVSGLAGNFGSPYRSHLFSSRFDWKINQNHSLLFRYSHDQNRGFGPTEGVPSPSNWLQNQNYADQVILGVTSTLKPTLVNDVRFNVSYWQNRNFLADQQTCPNCLGLGLPDLDLLGSGNFGIGNNFNAPQGRDVRRFNILDHLTWQRGSHRLRFGT